ncbi:MAG: conjugal transfer protein TraP [Citrobacter sp.]
MMNRILSFSTHVLHWLAWTFQVTVIWPAASMVLLFMFMFIQEGTTPGRMMADEIELAKKGVKEGQFLVTTCYDGAGDLNACGSSVPQCYRNYRIDAEGYITDFNDNLFSKLIIPWFVFTLFFAVTFFFFSPTSPRYSPLKAGGNEGDVK